MRIGGLFSKWNNEPVNATSNPARARAPTHVSRWKPWCGGRPNRGRGAVGTDDLLWRAAGLLFLAYTCLWICLPRLYLGLHYPSDLIGGALVFGGNSSYASIAAFQEDFTGGITIEGWVYFSSTSNDSARIIDMGNG